ncbi:hypothetical protein LJC58_10155 [Lachnospiraceae bacterium OttesenSCG-928-D06]|nr:hypothetical protein [Lachnospiraceae bacterium OttesenSCG-928-D06]
MSNAERKNMNIKINEVCNNNEFCLFLTGNEKKEDIVFFASQFEKKYIKKIRFCCSTISSFDWNITELIYIPDLCLINELHKSLQFLIVDTNLTNVRTHITTLKKYNLVAYHIDFFIKDKLSIELLKIFDILDFEDANKNRVIINKKTTSNISIIKSKPDISNCYINMIGTTSTNGLTITIFGSNAKIITGTSSYNKVVINIGSNAEITCGDDSMLSAISIMQTDQHHIFDLNTKERINKGKNIHIGNHVWIGRSCMLLGGAEIADNCVLGACSITSGKFSEKNCIIAGNPAKIIRHNIIWSRDELYYDYQNFEMCNDKSALKYIDELSEE